MLLTPDTPGIITKLTKAYCYYCYKNYSGRISLARLWKSIDQRRLDVIYKSEKGRRKQRKLRTLDLHEIRHSEAEEKLRTFFNFIELPCEVITGNSSYMINLVGRLAEEYGWSHHQKDDFNLGSYIVCEKR